jgi:E3 ubiquitin-protein ligase SIAH1
MDFAHDLLEELECPVCFEYFQPPIAICKNGHSICGKCKSKVRSCPVCRAAILNTTNITLEKVMQKLKVRCEFSNSGCNVTSSILEIRKHELSCPRRPYKCPITECNWNRPLSDIKIHLQMRHDILVQAQNGEYITTLGDFGKKSLWYTGLSFCNKIFLQVSKIKGDKFYTCVLHVGREDVSSQFTYAVEIGAGDNKSVSAYHKVRNCAGGIDRMIRLGYCASFTKYFAQMCLTKRSVLRMNVRMYATQF